MTLSPYTQGYVTGVVCITVARLIIDAITLTRQDRRRRRR